MLRYGPDILDKLQERLSTLQKELAQAKDAAAIVVLDQSSQGRLSRMDAMQQQEMALNHLSRMQTVQRKLEAAIARFHEGSYGVCCKCGDDMGPERIKYEPAAPFCAECVS
jgi:DnaK suppressor protein